MAVKAGHKLNGLGNVINLTNDYYDGSESRPLCSTCLMLHEHRRTRNEFKY